MRVQDIAIHSRGTMLLIGVCACLAAMAAAASAQTYISDIAQPVGCERASFVKPRDIKLYSGAGLHPLRWRGWGNSVARASGTAVIADKSHSPYTVHRYPVRVRAYRPRRCAGRRAYTRLWVQFVRRVPSGFARDNTYRIV